MKKLLVFFISIAMLLAVSMPAWASLTTPWVITDTQSTQYPLVEIVPGLNLNWPDNLEFGVYDIGSVNGINSRIALIDETHLSAKLTYDNSSNLQYESRFFADDTTPAISGTLTLNTPGQFGFYFYDGTNVVDYKYSMTAENQYQLYNLTADYGIVISSDIAPVPIPGAALLLGSGLIGLVGFRRRTNVS